MRSLGGRGTLHARCALALLLFFAYLVHHVLAQLVTGHAELLPPVGQHLVHLTRVGAQAHEVKRSPKACLLCQAKGGAAHALLKAGLHHPYLAHVTGQFAPA